MAEGWLVLPLILERLAERELEMQSIIIRQAVRLERRAHRAHVLAVEAKGLEIGEAPVDFTERRLQGSGAAVGRYALGQASLRLQRVAVTHPDLRLLRKVFEHRLINLDRLTVIARTCQQRRLEIAVAGIARLLRQQLIDVRQRLRGSALSIQHHRIVVAGGIEGGSQFQAAFQQRLGVRIAFQAAGHFGEHAQRCHIRGE